MSDWLPPWEDLEPKRYRPNSRSTVTIDAIHALGPSGVATLQGIPGSASFEVDCGDFHAELVTANKALLGVVNARRSHFESAAAWLDTAPTEVLESLVTDFYGVDEAEQALEDSPDTMKVVVSFDG